MSAPSAGLLLTRPNSEDVSRWPSAGFEADSGDCDDDGVDGDDGARGGGEDKEDEEPSGEGGGLTAPVGADLAGSEPGLAAGAAGFGAERGGGPAGGRLVAAAGGAGLGAAGGAGFLAGDAIDGSARGAAGRPAWALLISDSMTRSLLPPIMIRCSTSSRRTSTILRRSSIEAASVMASLAFLLRRPEAMRGRENIL
ncbi:MAG: hypothetical protein ABJQ85_03275 [Rhizobiaceae bacterium]